MKSFYLLENHGKVLTMTIHAHTHTHIHTHVNSNDIWASPPTEAMTNPGSFFATGVTQKYQAGVQCHLPGKMSI